MNRNVDQNECQFASRCDRSCFIFWREEWLEKIENQSSEM